MMACVIVDDLDDNQPFNPTWEAMNQVWGDMYHDNRIKQVNLNWAWLTEIRWPLVLGTSTSEMIGHATLTAITITMAGLWNSFENRLSMALSHTWYSSDFQWLSKSDR